MTDKIVVGVDGSPGSVLALQWAVDEAEARYAELVIVHAWHVPSGAYMPFVPASTSTVEMMTEAAEKTLAETRAEVVIPSYVGVRDVIVEGPPAPKLLQEAADASLLVVGSRGRGGFSGLLLG